MVAGLFRFAFLCLAVSVAWPQGAAASSPQAVMVVSVSGDGIYPPVITEALHSMFYAEPSTNWLAPQWVIQRTDRRLAEKDFDPRTAEGRERLRQFGFDHAVTGSVGDLLTIEVWSDLSSESPSWTGSHPLSGPEDLGPALHALLPATAEAVGAELAPALQVLVQRPAFRTMAGIEAFGAGVSAYFPGRYAEAERHFRRAVDAEPGVADGSNYLGWAQAGQGRWAEAQSSFQRATDLLPDYFDALWGLQQAHDNAGAFDRAEAIRQSIPAVYASHPDVLTSQFTARLAAGDRQGASAILDSLRAAAGRSAFFRFDVLRQEINFSQNFDPAATVDLLEREAALTSAICRTCAQAVFARHALAAALREASRWGEALPIETELAEALTVLDDQTADPLLEQLARWAARDGRDEQAVVLYRRLAEARDVRLGPAAVDTARAWQALGMALSDQPTGGEDEMRRAIAAFDGLAGERVRHGSSLITLGRILSRDGRHAEALVEFRRSYALLRDAAGERAYETLTAQHWVAEALFETGAVDESIAAYGETLASFEAVYGSNHAETARVHYTMGWVLHKAGRAGDAADAYGRSAEIRSAVYSEPDHRTALSWYYTATSARDAGRYQDSLSAAERAATLFEALDGPENRNVARARTLMGVALTRLGELDRALAIHQVNLELLRRVEPEDGLWVDYTLHDMGRIHWRSDRLPEAEFAFRAALIGYVAAGKKDSTTAYLWSDLGDVLREQERWVEAVDAHQEAIHLLETNFGAESAPVARELRSLGRALQGGGMPEDAAFVYGRALEISRAVEPDNEGAVGFLLDNLASAYLAMGRLDDAASRAEQAIAALVKAYGSRSEQTIWARHRLGVIRDTPGALSGAESAYRSALVLAWVHGAEWPEYQWFVGRDTGAVWLRQGRAEAAIVLLKLSANAALSHIRDGGTSPGEIRGLLENLDAALRAAGRGDEAHGVRQLMESGDAAMDVPLEPAEAVWGMRLANVAQRIRDIEAEDGDAGLGWLALERAMEELYAVRLLRAGGP